ncbi:putative membrane protein (Fun14 family) [Halopiger aswanensis]|uniref:Putative membrane protein (Fun14 family) n=2 Tax=Halopiger aswanensis TaxID=148449 RepID=A0A419WP83_9EURY|nr:putative membrane protein (Fun14 family) [Halopiger aswanensis]
MVVAMIDVDPATLALEFGGGLVIGALVGFGTKRVAKVLAIVVGIQLMAFRYLESQGIVIVDYERLSAGLVGSGEQVDGVATPWLESVLSTLTIGTGFASGFLIGFHRG